MKEKCKTVDLEATEKNIENKQSNENIIGFPEQTADLRLLEGSSKFL